MRTPLTTPLLTLTGQTDCSFVAATAPTTRTVEWAIGAPAAAQVTGRPPLNLALVLDRSGSMAGDKLRYAQAAANHVLALLEARDRAAIVAYDDQIIVAAPSEPVTPSARQRMRGQVERLQPGGSTDLAGGWLAGCDQVASHQGSGGLHRALLLTDGLANVGITDVTVLMEYAQGLRARGVTTSTSTCGSCGRRARPDAPARRCTWRWCSTAAARCAGPRWRWPSARRSPCSNGSTIATAWRWWSSTTASTSYRRPRP